MQDPEGGKESPEVTVEALDDDIEDVDISQLRHADSYFAEEEQKQARKEAGGDEGEQQREMPPSRPELGIMIKRHVSETLTCDGVPHSPSAAESLNRQAVTQVMSWGRGEEAQLMHETPHNEPDPKPVAKFDTRYRIVDLANGANHALALTDNGTVFASGANDEGQILSDKETQAVLAPVAVENLSSQQVVQVSAGLEHSACLLASQTVVTFGHNEYGQCGHSPDKPFRVPPKMMTGLRATKVVQVACGERHTMLLSSYGEVFTCGSGAWGALGHGDRDNKPQPTRIEALNIIPITQISAGNVHSAAVTATGSVYTWGRNRHGRLGVPAEVVEHAAYKPVRVKKLPCDVQQSVCGGSHTVFVGREGELFVAGRGHNGCLGLGSAVDAQFVPVQVPKFKNRRVRAAACGQSHTLVLTANGDVWAMGSNAWGQLGVEQEGNCYEPVLVKALKSAGTFHISAGGDSSMAIRVVRGSVLSRPAGTLPKKSLHSTSCQQLIEAARASTSATKFRELRAVISDIFSHPAALNASFLKRSHGNIFFRDTGREGLEESEGEGKGEDAEGEESAVDGVDIVKAAPGKGEGEDSSASEIELTPAKPKPAASDDVGISMGFTAAAASGAGAGVGAGAAEPSFDTFDHAQHSEAEAQAPEVPSSDRIVQLKHPSIVTSNGTIVRVTSPRLQSSGLDIAGLEQAYKAIFDTHDKQVILTLTNAIENTLLQLSDCASSLADPDCLRVFLILLMNPLNTLVTRGNILGKLCKCIVALPPASQGTLMHWIGSDVPEALFASRLVRPLQKNLTDAFKLSFATASPLVCLAFMLFKLNEQIKVVKSTEFHNATASSVPDNMLMVDYQAWRKRGANVAKQGPGVTFCLCEYPFLLDADAKRRILRCEARLQMQTMLNAQMATWLRGLSPFYVLSVHRERLMDSALNQLSMTHPHQLKKPLKVVFVGEEGIDEGGVTKEFFQLLVRQMFDVKYGMFTYDEDTRNFWFRPAQFDLETLKNNFKLVGVVFGLALYNGVLLDVRLPHAMYRKMLQAVMTLDDLKSVDPVVGDSLQAILDYEGDDAEDVFCLDFTATYEAFGESVVVELVPGGKDKPVTSENRELYVAKYVEWALETSIAEQFKAFMGGFLLVLDGPSLSLFGAQDLELLVCGTPDLDFEALESGAVYDGGFTASTPAIKWFWEIVRGWDMNKQSKLLLFATGCAKAPIGGLGKLQFKIQRNGGAETKRLPTAATCFNTLLLPEYGSKETMQQLLEIAIEECQGFGLK